MNDNRLTELHQVMTEKGIFPSELYKYISISNNLYKTLINAELWFASPLSFNDPFDCQINDKTNWTDDLIKEYLTIITGSQETAEEKILTAKLTPATMADFYKKSSEKVLAKIGVSCFTDRPCNLLMWAHYADSHKGVCLKFDTTEDLNLFNTSIKVKYSKEYPEFNYLTDRDKLVEKKIQTKSDHWAYEDEIRVLKLDKFGTSPFAKKSLKEIIFGCKTDTNEINTIKNIVKTGLYPNVKFKQVKLKGFSFSVEIIDI